MLEVEEVLSSNNNALASTRCLDSKAVVGTPCRTRESCKDNPDEEEESLLCQDVVEEVGVRLLLRDSNLSSSTNRLETQVGLPCMASQLDSLRNR